MLAQLKLEPLFGKAKKSALDTVHGWGVFNLPLIKHLLDS